MLASGDGATCPCVDPKDVRTQETSARKFKDFVEFGGKILDWSSDPRSSLSLYLTTVVLRGHLTLGARLTNISNQA